MKKFFLKHKARKALSEQKQRSNISFEKASKVGILFDSEEDFRSAADFLKRINTGSRDVKSLVKIKKNKKEQPPFPHFSDKEISFFGRINSSLVDAFIKTPFDYLFYFGSGDELVMRYILGASRAKCRVGFHHPGKEQLFDLMLGYNKNRSFSENTIHVLEQLEAIKVHD